MREQNRIFMLIAIALIVLLALGLLGIGGWALVFRPRQQAAVTAGPATPVAEVATATSTPVPATATPSASPTPRATNTPVRPAATHTPTTAPVVSKPTDTPTSAVTAPPASPIPSPTSAEATPQTGFGPGIALIAAVGLAGLLFATRRLRKV